MYCFLCSICIAFSVVYVLLSLSWFGTVNWKYIYLFTFKDKFRIVPPIQEKKKKQQKKPLLKNQWAHSLSVSHGGCFRCWEKQRFSTSSPYITRRLLARPQDKALPFSPFPMGTSSSTYAALPCSAAPFAAGVKTSCSCTVSIVLSREIGFCKETEHQALG